MADRNSSIRTTFSSVAFIHSLCWTDNAIGLIIDKDALSSLSLCPNVLDVSNPLPGNANI